MQRLDISGAVRLIYRSLGVKGLKCTLSHMLLNLSVLHLSVRSQTLTYLDVAILFVTHIPEDCHKRGRNM